MHARCTMGGSNGHGETDACADSRSRWPETCRRISGGCRVDVPCNAPVLDGAGGTERVCELGGLAAASRVGVPGAA